MDICQMIVQTNMYVINRWVVSDNKFVLITRFAVQNTMAWFLIPPKFLLPSPWLMVPKRVIRYHIGMSYDDW